jgi:hypothetical protein
MGSSQSTIKEKEAIGDKLIKDTRDYIYHTKNHLSGNPNPNEKTHLKNSICSDLNSLDNLIINGCGIKVGIIGRDERVSQLTNTLFINTELTRGDSLGNTFISSDKIKFKNILNENGLDPMTQNIATPLMDFHFKSHRQKNSNIKLANYTPIPSFIQNNLIYSTTGSMKNFTENDASSEIDFGIDMDDLTKFLLFSILHDLTIYVPSWKLGKIFFFK